MRDREDREESEERKVGRKGVETEIEESVGEAVPRMEALMAGKSAGIESMGRGRGWDEIGSVGKANTGYGVDVADTIVGKT